MLQRKKTSTLSRQAEPSIRRYSKSGRQSRQSVDVTAGEAEPSICRYNSISGAGRKAGDGNAVKIVSSSEPSIRYKVT